MSAPDGCGSSLSVCAAQSGSTATPWRRSSSSPATSN